MFSAIIFLKIKLQKCSLFQNVTWGFMCVYVYDCIYELSMYIYLYVCVYLSVCLYMYEETITLSSVLVS